MTIWCLLVSLNSSTAQKNNRETITKPSTYNITCSLTGLNNKYPNETWGMWHPESATVSDKTSLFMPERGQITFSQMICTRVAFVIKIHWHNLSHASAGYGKPVLKRLAELRWLSVCVLYTSVIDLWKNFRSVIKKIPGRNIRAKWVIRIWTRVSANYNLHSSNCAS